MPKYNEKIGWGRMVWWAHSSCTCPTAPREPGSKPGGGKKQKIDNSDFSKKGSN